MKKILIILFATLLSSISAFSQVTPSSGISGSGTTGYIPKFTSSKKVGNSQVFDNGTFVGINTATRFNTEKLRVGGALLTDDYIISKSTNGYISVNEPVSGNPYIGIYANSGASYLQSFGNPLQINPLGNDVKFSHSSTKVYIGSNNTPDARLQILTPDNLSTTSGLLVTQNVTGDDLFRIKGNGYSNFSASTMLGIGGNAAANNRVAIQGVSGAAASDNILSCFPYGGAFYALAVKEDGKIGIGTNSPTAKLHVVGDDNSGISLKTQSLGSSWGGGISINNGSKNHLIAQGGADYNNSLFFKSNVGTYITQFDENGNARIGYPTSSAIDAITARLYIYSSSGSILKLDGVPTSSTSLTTSDIYAIGNDVRIVSAITTNSTVTQATSKTTSVTINTISGDITTNNSNMAANQKDVFTVSNSSVSADDLIILNHVSGGDIKDYSIKVGNIASGSFQIMIKNENGGGLTDALVLRYKIVKK